MKKKLLLCLLAIPSFIYAQTTNMLMLDGYNAPQIRLGSLGTYWGKIGNPAAQVWSLGFGNSDAMQQTSVLSWTPTSATTGKVGINMSPGTNTLDVSGNIGTSAMLVSSAYNAAQIRLNSSGTYYGKIGNPSAQVWSLGYGDDLTGISPVLNWAPNGYVGVGVGTTAPSAKFHINQTGGGWADGIRMSLSGNSWDLVADNGGGRFVITRNQNMLNGLIIDNGNVGIGTSIADFKLTVNGKIKAEELQIIVDVPADYVFAPEYKLMSLSEVSRYVSENNHLPNVPAAAEIKENGWQVGEMSNALLEKVEELTLYLIQLSQENENLKARLEKLENAHK
jgi:hypothetical protein